VLRGLVAVMKPDEVPRACIARVHPIGFGGLLERVSSLWMGSAFSGVR
jgi:hypothetical protein